MPLSRFFKFFEHLQEGWYVVLEVDEQLDIFTPILLELLCVLLLDGFVICRLFLAVQDLVVEYNMTELSL